MFFTLHPENTWNIDPAFAIRVNEESALAKSSIN